MSIAEGIAAIRATLELAKLTSDLVKRPNVDASDVQAKLHEMLIHAVNAQTALVEAQLEISALRQERDDREEWRAVKADMEFVQDGGFYVRLSERNKKMFTPYCPVCLGRDNKAVPLVPVSNGRYQCAIHNAYYETEAYKQAMTRAFTDAFDMPRGPNSWMAR